MRLAFTSVAAGRGLPTRRDRAPRPRPCLPGRACLAARRGRGAACHLRRAASPPRDAAGISGGSDRRLSRCPIIRAAARPWRPARRHIFVDEARLVGVIEGGDALWGDPYYELPALFFGTFGESKPLLRAFNRAARAWTGVRHRPAAVRAGRAFPGGSKRARTHRGDVRGAGTGAGWHRPASVQRSSNDPFARLSFPTLSWAG